VGKIDDGSAVVARGDECAGPSSRRETRPFSIARDRRGAHRAGRRGTVSVTNAPHPSIGCLCEVCDVVIDDLVAEGDLVTDRVHLDGTQTGDFFGVPATGKPIHIEAIEEWRIADGKIVEGWHVENLLQVLIQVGAIPAPGAEAAPSPAASPSA
jgi:SnoaL-like polyketide cyclase